jgi:hypothetical protein
MAAVYPKWCGAAMKPTLSGKQRQRSKRMSKA